MIISLASHRDKLARAARLRSLVPYCGVCEAASGEINDLVPCKRYDGPDSLFCGMCGEEFR